MWDGVRIARSLHHTRLDQKGFRGFCSEPIELYRRIAKMQNTRREAELLGGVATGVAGEGGLSEVGPLFEVGGGLR